VLSLKSALMTLWDMNLLKLSQSICRAIGSAGQAILPAAGFQAGRCPTWKGPAEPGLAAPHLTRSCHPDLRASVVVVLLIMVSSAMLPGQTSARPPFIRASGDASVFVAPDQVIIDATITTQGKTAQDASAQNATQVAAVLTALRQFVGANANITTVNYFIGPVYQYPQGGGTPVLIGFTASNTVETTLNVVSMAGAVIDTAVQAGATSVGGLRFALKDPEPARNQALRMATLLAKAHADAMANGVGGKVGAVISLQEGTAVRVQPIVGVANGGASPPTTIQPGMVEVDASVTLEAQLTTS
jgi:uncharacterized protein YggE